MTAELGEWLAELGESDPATAVEVGAAVVAVLDAAEPSGLASVGEPSTPLSADPREAADHVYEQMLAELQQVRRRVSDVATDRRQIELLLERRIAGVEPAEIAELEQNLAAAQQQEASRTEVSQRRQWEVDAFRTAKESAKAMYTAAEAQLRIAEVLEATGAGPDADLARLTAALNSAQERLERVTAQGRNTLDLIREQRRGAGEPIPAAAADRPTPPPPQPHPAADPAPGLLELRVEPAGSDIRILFALEPADTVTLLAVLEGPEAISEHGAEAVELARSLLTEIREDGWPADVDQVSVENSAAFQARFVTPTS